MARDEERKADGCPLLHANSVQGTLAHTANGPATAFWHMRQWQMPIRGGSAKTTKRTAPHWQPPVCTGVRAWLGAHTESLLQAGERGVLLHHERCVLLQHVGCVNFFHRRSPEMPARLPPSRPSSALEAGALPAALLAFRRGSELIARGAAPSND